MSWFESVSPKVDSSTSAKPFNPEQASLAQLGAFSPLWMLFLGASAAGMAVWGMTRWMRLAAPERSEPVVRLRLVKSEPETPDEPAATLPAAEVAVPIAIKPDVASVAPAEPAAEAPAAKAAPAAPQAKLAEPPAKVAAPEPEAKRAAPAPKPAPEAPKPEAKAAPAAAAKPAAAPVSTPAKPAAAPARAAKAPVAKPAAPAKAAAPKPATRRGPPRKS